MASDLAEPTSPFEHDSNPFEITVVGEGADTVLNVAGEVDLATAPTLRMCLDHAIADSSGSIVLDLAGVPFMDSSGINVIVRGATALADARRALVVRGTSPNVLRIFQVIGLDQSVTIDGADTGLTGS